MLLSGALNNQLNVLCLTFFKLLFDGGVCIHFLKALTLSSGLIIYFGYGVRNSVQKQRLREARIQLNTAVNGDVVR